MLTTITKPAAQESGQTEHSQTPSKPIESFDKAAVAGLLPLQISRMTGGELVRAIRAAQLPLLRPEIHDELDYYDRTTLERLLYRARRCCRNQGY